MSMDDPRVEQQVLRNIEKMKKEEKQIDQLKRELADAKDEANMYRDHWHFSQSTSENLRGQLAEMVEVQRQVLSLKMCVKELAEIVRDAAQDNAYSFEAKCVLEKWGLTFV